MGNSGAQGYKGGSVGTSVAPGTRGWGGSRRCKGGVGRGMVEGRGEELEEEHDVLRTYMEIYDNNFDYDF